MLYHNTRIRALFLGRAAVLQTSDDLIDYDELVSNVFQSILKPIFLHCDKQQTRRPRVSRPHRSFKQCVLPSDRRRVSPTAGALLYQMQVRG